MNFQLRFWSDFGRFLLPKTLQNRQKGDEKWGPGRLLVFYRFWRAFRALFRGLFGEFSIVITDENATGAYSEKVSKIVSRRTPQTLPNEDPGASIMALSHDKKNPRKSYLSFVDFWSPLGHSKTSKILKKVTSGRSWRAPGHPTAPRLVQRGLGSAVLGPDVRFWEGNVSFSVTSGKFLFSLRLHYL